MVFSAEHSFCVSQIVKPPFEAPSQNGFKSAVLGFPLCLLKPTGNYYILNSEDTFKSNHNVMYRKINLLPEL